MSDDKPDRGEPIDLSTAGMTKDGWLECPTCGCRDFRVAYGRVREGEYRRVRECRHCGRRIVTHEVTRTVTVHGFSGSSEGEGCPWKWARMLSTRKAKAERSC